MTPTLNFLGQFVMRKVMYGMMMTVRFSMLKTLT